MNECIYGIYGQSRAPEPEGLSAQKNGLMVDEFIDALRSEKWKIKVQG